MNLNKKLDNNIKIKVLIIIIILIFFLSSKFFLGDDRKFPVESILGEKKSINGFNILVKDPMYNPKNKILGFDIDFYVEDYDFISTDDEKKEFKMYYANPKKEIKEFQIYYKTKLINYKATETKEKKKIVISVQIPLDYGLEENLGIVFQFLTYQKQWDEMKEKSYYEEVSKISLGIDYRDVKIQEFPIIKTQEIDKESKEYIEYIILMKNTVKSSYTDESNSENTHHEHAEISAEEEQESLDRNISILEGQKNKLEKEIEEIKNNIENLDYTEEQIEIQNKILETKEEELDKVNQELEYYLSIDLGE